MFHHNTQLTCQSPVQEEEGEEDKEEEEIRAHTPHRQNLQ
jgi:hypothetical protein